MRIALVDDDQDVLDFVDTALAAYGHINVRYKCGRDVLAALQRETFDLLLLDWNMPGMSGMEVLRWARSNLADDIPVLMLTNRWEKDDITGALNAGADDFIVKPETADVIAARVNAALRRTSRPKNRAGIDRFGRYVFDSGTETVSLDDESIPLTSKEFALARLFFANPHRPLSRSYLFEAVWRNVAELSTRTLDMHISRIRSKLRLSSENGYRLQTVFGYGYRLETLSLARPELVADNRSGTSCTAGAIGTDDRDGTTG